MISYSYVQMINGIQMIRYSYVQMITNESLPIKEEFIKTNLMKLNLNFVEYVSVILKPLARIQVAMM